LIGLLLRLLSVSFYNVYLCGNIMMSTALKKRGLVCLGEALKVHFCHNLVEKFEILYSFVNYTHKSFLVHKVRWSEIFRVGIEPWKSFGYYRRISIAVISDFFSRLAINHLQCVFTVFLVAISLGININSASFENINPLVPKWLINKVVGRKQTMREFTGNRPLESVTPLGQEEKRRFDDP